MAVGPTHSVPGQSFSRATDTFVHLMFLKSAFIIMLSIIPAAITSTCKCLVYPPLILSLCSFWKVDVLERKGDVSRELHQTLVLYARRGSVQ